MDKNRKLKWDKTIKGRKITNTYGENYLAGDDTMGLFQQADNNSWTPVSVEQARDIYVPNVTDPVSNSYTQLGPMPTLTVTSPDWETVPYNVEDTRFEGRTPITTINVRRNKNTGKILPEDYRQVLAIKDWYAKQHPKSDPSENALNDAVFTALTLGANKNLETTAKGISSLVSKVDPVVKTSFREGIAKPMLLGSLVDQTQKAITGTSLSDQTGSWLTNDYGWNPYVGDLTNPGYNMSGYAGNLLNKSVNSFIKGITNLKDFGINNGRKLINRWNHPNNVYAQDYAKMSDEGLHKLYNAFINGYATDGKLPNDNTRVTNKQLVLPIEDDPNISIIRRVNSSPADFVQRLKDPNRKVIKLPNGQVATHKMGWATIDRRPVVFPLVQNINGKLVDFENKGWTGLDSAINRGDTIHMTSPQEAEWFTTHYKNYYPSFNKYADGR